MVHSFQTALIMLTTEWLVRLSLAPPVDTWGITPPSLLGTKTPRPLLHLPPCTQQSKLPRSLTLKDLSHTDNRQVVLVRPN